MRARGEGTLYQNANGTWTAQISTDTGRPSKTFTGQRKARKWLTEQKRLQDTDSYVEPSDILLSAWWDKWIVTYKGGNKVNDKTLTKDARYESNIVSRSSISTYLQSKKRITKHHPSLLKCPLSSITRSIIQDAINSLSESYSDATTRQTYIHLHDCLNYAVEDNLIYKNPCQKISLPKRRDDVPKTKAMTPGDLEKFVLFCQSPPRLTAKGVPDKRAAQRQVYKQAALVLLSTGLRRGELCALVWDDFVPGGLSVSKSVSDSGNVTIPKTPESVAIVPITENIRRMLLSMPRNGKHIFTSATGNHLSPSTLYHWMTTNSKKILGRKYTVHEMRHTFASEAARRGINPKVLQTITRHKRIETLLKYYTHIDDEQRQEAVDAINPANCKRTANAE